MSQFPSHRTTAVSHGMSRQQRSQRVAALHTFPSAQPLHQFTAQEDSGVSRDELAAALTEVAEGRLPKDRIALRELAREMSEWPYADLSNDSRLDQLKDAGEQFRMTAEMANRMLSAPVASTLLMHPCPAPSMLPHPPLSRKAAPGATSLQSFEPRKSVEQSLKVMTLSVWRLTIPSHAFLVPCRARGGRPEAAEAAGARQERGAAGERSCVPFSLDSDLCNPQPDPAALRARGARWGKCGFTLRRRLHRLFHHVGCWTASLRPSWCMQML